MAGRVFSISYLPRVLYPVWFPLISDEPSYPYFQVSAGGVPVLRKVSLCERGIAWRSGMKKSEVMTHIAHHEATTDCS